MFTYLHVKNLALIEEAEVEFGEGLNILTGETGAGKSVIIGSVNLALGAKVPKDIIRRNAEYAVVELVFEVESSEQIKALQSLDIPMEEKQVVITRRLTGQRSVCKVNGEVVPVAVLQKIREILIDIHGQHEHQSLTHKKKHLQLLDEFGCEKLKAPKDKMRLAYKKYKECCKNLLEFESNDENREREIAFLQYEINEIENSNLSPGEDEKLESSYKKMVHGKKIAEACMLVHNLTGYETEGCAGETIGKAVRELSAVAGYDERLEELYEQIRDVEGILNDFNRQITDYASDLEFSQEDFIKTEERLNTVNHLKSKYGASIEAVLEYAGRQQEKLNQLIDYEENIRRMKKEQQVAEQELKTISEEVSKIRKELAKELAAQIRISLHDLNFADVRFEMEVRPLSEYQENGMDEAEFMISTNPGEPLKPLGMVASGGELSRIMLAIKTVMATKDDVDTLIFDEIDTGISGRTAQKVSEKLSIIGKNRQIICITHLPQIAAMADVHFSIEKNVKMDETLTTIHKLSEEEQIQELARILGGAKITETVIQSAREMKELANRTK